MLPRALVPRANAAGVEMFTVQASGLAAGNAEASNK